MIPPLLMYSMFVQNFIIKQTLSAFIHKLTSREFWANQIALLEIYFMKY